MLHPAEAGLAARRARRALAALARPVGAFDASRYFRGGSDLRFFNVGTPRVRALAREVRRAHPDWSADEALAFAGRLMPDPVLEVKGLAVAVLAGYRRTFRPAHLRVWQRWLSGNLASNWATTDQMCGELIGPLLAAHPRLAARMRAWAGSRNLWVRRASAVALIPLVRRGGRLALAYDVAARLRPDDADLIHKAVGWMLREAGKTDPARLEAYLRRHGARTPRTTIRYAIERFPASRRQALLRITRGVPGRRIRSILAVPPGVSRIARD